jgi:hypothetical protein
MYFEMLFHAMYDERLVLDFVFDRVDTGAVVEKTHFPAQTLRNADPSPFGFG